jgi:type I restriction enzyme M protein
MAISPKQLSSHLWSAVDQLRGSISTYEAMEYLTGLVFLRLLTQKSANENRIPGSDAAHSEVDPEIWREVVEDSANPHEALTRAVERLESEDHQRYGELLTFLPLRRLASKPQLCRQLVDVVSGIDLEGVESHELGSLVDVLLVTFAAASGVQGGEFYTSPDIAALLVRILDPQPGKLICDPACGTGSLLLSAYQHVVSKDKSDGGPQVLGQELNRRTASYTGCRRRLFQQAIAYFSPNSTGSRLGSSTSC